MRQWMTDALAHHQRGKNGQIVYNLKRDFGLDAAAVRKRFGFYFERFAAQPEVK